MGATVDDSAEKAAHEGGAATEGGKDDIDIAEIIKKEAAQGKVREAGDYTIGESAEVRMESGDWVPCKIVANGEEPLHYKIEIEPDCCQDAYLYEGTTPEVSVICLRKATA